MAKKRHHMTKHAFDVEEEDVKQGRTKSRKKSEENTRNLLRDVQGNLTGFLDEEPDDGHDLKATKTLGSVKERETRLKELEQ